MKQLDLTGVADELLVIARQRDRRQP